jgi:hypothetical protein
MGASFMGPQRLVLFVEGKGDVSAVPTIAARVLASMNGDDALFVDSNPFRVAGLGTLLKDNGNKWQAFLHAASKTRPHLAAVLLVLDGDLDHVPKTWAQYVQRFGSTTFCPVHAAGSLVEAGRTARAGESFSLASVFIMKEFEAWLLAGIESLRGTKLPEDRGVVPIDAHLPNIDHQPKRNAKQEITEQIPFYQEPMDQHDLARRVDLPQIRMRCRSFRRFESAISKLVDATRAGSHIISPML